MRTSYAIQWLALAWTATSACRHFQSPPKLEKECASRATLLVSPGEATPAFQRIATSSFSCSDDCESRIRARACELGADAVIVDAAERTAHGPGAGHVQSTGEPLKAGSSPFSGRDEQGNLMAPTRSGTTRQATFIRWTD